MAIKKGSPKKRNPRYKTVEGFSIRLGEKYLTRGGKTVVIEKYDHGDIFPVEGSTLDYLSEGGESELSWKKDGFYLPESKNHRDDLMRPSYISPVIAKRISGKVDDSVTGINIKILRPDGTVRKTGTVDLKDVNDAVNHPTHYTSHPSGIECIQITEHMGFNLGNAFKYIWRADMKNGLEDLKKAEWYIKREIAKREKVK